MVRGWEFRHRSPPMLWMPMLWMPMLPRDRDQKHQKHQIRYFRLKAQPESMDFMGVPPASDALDADATPRQGSTQHQQHQIRPFRLKKQPESSSFDGFDGGPPASDALDADALDADATPRQGSKPSIPSIPSIGSLGSKIVFSTSLTPSTQTEPTQKQLRARFWCSRFWTPMYRLTELMELMGFLRSRVRSCFWPLLQAPGTRKEPSIPSIPSIGSSGSKIVFSTSLTPSTQTEPTQKQLRARFWCSRFWTPMYRLTELMELMGFLRSRVRSCFWPLLQAPGGPQRTSNSVNRFFGIENRLLDLVDAYVSLSSWPGLVGPGAGCGGGAGLGIAGVFLSVGRGGA